MRSQVWRHRDGFAPGVICRYADFATCKIRM